MAVKLYIVLVCAALFAWTGLARATYSSQIWVPSTDIQAFGVPHLGVDTYNCLGKSFSGRTVATINYGITVGAIPDDRLIGAEFGVDYRDVGGNTENPWFYNAKFGLKEGKVSPWQPALVVGVFDLGGRREVTAANIVYGLASKNFSDIGRFSLGYYSGSRKVLVDETGRKANTGLLASWDRTFGGKFWAAVDFMSGQSSYGAINIGGAYYLTEKTSFSIGYDFYNNDRLHVPTFTFQLDMNL